MGCLNSNKNFRHWFGNIHLSGPCNRKCYFCIGQHMMGLDKYNVLDQWPLKGLDEFIKKCKEQNIKEINLTGSNTDPLLYNHTLKLHDYLYKGLGYFFDFKVRTNAVANLDNLSYFNSGSVTICSLDEDIYKKMMGTGSPPDLKEIINYTYNWSDLKINIVLGPENVGDDLKKTLRKLIDHGVKRVNLREPYGQPRVGDPLDKDYSPNKYVFGNPVYLIDECQITYWDVHYTEVESINLYANGNVSEDYPITRGYDASLGEVLDQTHFQHGRHLEQWIS